MKKLLACFYDKETQNRSKILLLVSGVLIIGAAMIGISDNPPGIIVAYCSMIALVTSFVNHWTRPKKFIYLALFALLFFIITGILHNVFEGIGMLFTESIFLHPFMNVIGVIFFFVALFLCPAALLVGIVGALVTWIKPTGIKAN